MLTIGSLFSGIGGLELGLELAGLGPTLFQVEQDPYCRRVLAQHWPEVTRYEDVKTITALPSVDILCGGFPCQDVSSAGARKGLSGKRSGLWSEFARIVAAVQPPWVVVENVASGAALWVDPVCRRLGELGYEVLPVPVSAADVGAPHLRERIFIVAYSASARRKKRKAAHGADADRRPERDGGAGSAADAPGDGRSEPGSAESHEAGHDRARSDGGTRHAADADGQRGNPRQESSGGVPAGRRTKLARSERSGSTRNAADADGDRKHAVSVDEKMAGASSPGQSAADADSQQLRDERERRPGGWSRAICTQGHAEPDDDGQAGEAARPGGDELIPQAWEGRPPVSPVCRVDDGLLARLDADVPRRARGFRTRRLKALGNSVVPQCAEVVGWVIRELAGLVEEDEPC